MTENGDQVREGPRRPASVTIRQGGVQSVSAHEVTICQGGAVRVRADAVKVKQISRALPTCVLYGPNMKGG